MHSVSPVLVRKPSEESPLEPAVPDSFTLFLPTGERESPSSGRELEDGVESLTLPFNFASLERSPLPIGLSAELQLGEQSQQNYHLSSLPSPDWNEVSKGEVGLLSCSTEQYLFCVQPEVAAHQPFLSLDDGSLQFNRSLLETHIRMMSQEDMLPPYIHPWQLDGDCPSATLIHCKGLLRMYVTSKSNYEASRYTLESMKMETDRILSQQCTNNEVELLGSVQALLLYSTSAFFASIDNQWAQSSPFIVDAAFMAKLETVAYSLSLSGFVTKEEIEHTRPSSWEKWILAAAKRRTILVLYLFTLIFSSINHLPLYIFNSLKYLPSPEARSLWKARNKEEWGRAYNRWLVTWQNGGPFMFVELVQWTYPDCENQSDKSAAEERWQTWLADADEFGMLVVLEISRLVAIKSP
jgi:hypothetical protein